MRVALRARARQLGDSLDKSSDPGDVDVACPLLVSEVAYEQWHRFLFARFLEANGLLHHPEYGVAVTLADCEELADSLAEPDGWSVAARFAADVLPGIFKMSDPSAKVRFTREDLLAIESVVTGLPREILDAEDSLGWVYQYWQSRAKDEVNESGRRVGGADLSPVTQLFTENYMVRFLLENTLGAWWAVRHPQSDLLRRFEYLRLNTDGLPEAGAFGSWPTRIEDVTVIDPCCGSGHFLVTAFGMLWRMRAESEGLTPADAQDAVLRENLFGLELDPRCTQIATFALALEAWKQGGYREIPVPQVACSGIPAKTPLATWTTFADGDPALESGLSRLRSLFADAETLGSLIDPVRSAEDAGLESVDWQQLGPLVQAALRVETSDGSRADDAVYLDAAAGIATAADFLSRRYTLVATNVPYLLARRQDPVLESFLGANFGVAAADIATSMLVRALDLAAPVGTTAIVSPTSWLQLRTYAQLRDDLLRSREFNLVARLGAGAFESISGEVVNVALTVIGAGRPERDNAYAAIDLSGEVGPHAKSVGVRTQVVDHVKQVDLRSTADRRILATKVSEHPLLSSVAWAYKGLTTGDDGRYRRDFWQLSRVDEPWRRIQSSPDGRLVSGCSGVVALGWMLDPIKPGVEMRGEDIWGRRGVIVKQMQDLPAALYLGHAHDQNAAVVVVKDDAQLPAVWAYLRSPEYAANVRHLDGSLKVTNATLVQVPFDADRWRSVAESEWSGKLPEPESDDATQWLFRGHPAVAAQPLQVAVARLLGFRWPDQQVDAIDPLIDSDGIVCLPAIAGEQAAAERVRAVMAAAYGASWTPAKLDELLAAAGGRGGDLPDWLANGFFKDHCKVFGNRPCVWHVWDGLRDGFSALVNYHRLDRATLEKLTYRTLGWWIDRQRADAESGVLGADARLGAAQALQTKLQLILEGEPPYDIYVRWKGLAEQPIGWDPDLDDGVRVNIRPFVEAGVLRSKFTIHWKKDRGTNPDGSERHNDLHYSVVAKRKARGLT
ncbi:MAG: DNA methyltransferase [Nocardioides sp.]